MITPPPAATRNAALVVGPMHSPDIRHSLTVPDCDQTLREWEFQGGPPRSDRWAGGAPTAYAALRGALLGLLWVPTVWLSLPLNMPWLPWLTAALIPLTGAAAFAVTRRATRHTEAALNEWDRRHAHPS